jgi:predicted glutamine amidotransferase
MCGLVGMAGNLDHSSKKALNAMLTLSSLRGMHSTGVLFVKGKDNNTEVVKQVGPPADLMDTRTYEKLSSYDATILAGHTRHATVGNVSRVTAHPFEFSNLIGMHNGTLQGWRGYLNDDEFFDVDSECIYHNINELGVDAVIPSLRGAWALVWYDKETGQLNFLRNKERSLWYCFNEDKDRIFWASEYWMLGMLKSKHGGGEKLYVDKDGCSFFPFEENMLTSMKIDNKKIVIKSQRKLEGDSTPPVAAQRPFQQPYTHPSWYQGQYNPYNQNSKLVEKKDGQEYLTSWERLMEEKAGDAKAGGTGTTKPSGAGAKNVPSSEANRTTLSGRSPSAPRRSLSLVTTNNVKNLVDLHNKKKSSKKKASMKESKDSSGGNEILILIESHVGDFINYDEFTNRTGGDCSFCQTSITETEFEQNHVHTWLDGESFLCCDCVDTNELTSVNS